MFRGRNVSVHFVGIGGIGMSGIAEVLLNLSLTGNRGYRVSGSDLRASDTTRRLEKLGAAISIGHKENNLEQVDVVVISSAVAQDNPEVDAARRRKIPIIARAEMLAELMRMKYGVAIAGSHGKTTTTSLIATILVQGGLDPTAVIGGKLAAFGSNARLGQGDYLVAEADESDGSFLRLQPTVSVVTNIDPEHLSHYGSVENLEAAFVEFIRKTPFYGVSVLCMDHPRVAALLPQCTVRHVTYGLTPQADYRAENIRAIPGTLEMHYDAVVGERRLGPVRLKLPGEHNVLNSLAALAVADFLEIPFSVFQQSVATFGGVSRRFTVRGEEGGIAVVDDYGHHPAEIRATIAAARQAYGRPLAVVFQPHRFTRTADLLDDFAQAFHQADRVYITDIYAAGEKPIPGIDATRLVEAISACGHRHVSYLPRAKVLETLPRELSSGDVLVTMGAGDIGQTSLEILPVLKAKRGNLSRPKQG